MTKVNFHVYYEIDEDEVKSITVTARAHGHLEPVGSA